MSESRLALGPAAGRSSLRRLPGAGVVAGTVLGATAIVLAVVAGAAPGERALLLAAALLGAAAGLTATSVGVFGGVLVPGLLLLGVEPRLAAALSLALQVLVVPLGAASHAALGHVRRAVAWPLAAGGVAGATAGALLASSVPAGLAGRGVALVVVVVGAVVLATSRARGAGRSARGGERARVRPARIAGIGALAGVASGVAGAGWGPIGVALLILARVEPREAIGSSLVARVAMAVAALLAYGLVAAGRDGLAPDPRLPVVLLAASGAAMIPGTAVLSRADRARASALVAVASIALAVPTLLGLG